MNPFSSEKNGCGILLRYDLYIFPVVFFCQVCAPHLKFTNVMFSCVQLEFNISGNYRASLSSHSLVYGLDFKQIHIMGDSVLTMLFGFLPPVPKKAFS